MIILESFKFHLPVLLYKTLSSPSEVSYKLSLYWFFILPLQHPNICPVVFSTTTESGGLTIRAYQEKGTLRDAVCKCKPKNHYLKKYASPKSCSTLELNAVKIVGKQILEALKFLHEKGLPYGKICSKIWFIYTRYQFISIWQLVGIELPGTWTLNYIFNIHGRYLLVADYYIKFIPC